MLKPQHRRSRCVRRCVGPAPLRKGPDEPDAVRRSHVRRTSRAPVGCAIGPGQCSGGHHRCRAGRPDRRLRAGQARAPAEVFEATDSRRHQPDGRARRLALRHRRPPLLLQGRRRSRSSGTRSCPTRLHRPAAPEPHLLRRQVLRLPAQGRSKALKNLGVIEPIRCVLSYAWARLRPPKDQTQLRGLGAQPVRRAAVLDLLQDLHREGVGHAGSRDPGRLGRAADQGPLASAARSIERRSLPSKRKARRQITALIEEFQYPQVRPGDDVGALPATWSRTGRRRSCMDRRCARIEHADGRPGRRRRDPARRAAREASTPRHVISSMPIAELVRAIDAAARRSVAGGRRRPALPRLPHRRPDRARAGSGFPDNWIYIHDPDVKVGRIQNFGSWSPDMVKDGRTCLGLEYFCFEGDEPVDLPPTRSWSSWPSASSARSAWSTRPTCEAGYVVRQPKAYPVYDDAYQANVEVIRDVARGELPEPASGRPQRHAQVQQPGPLDDDGHADGREHPRAAAPRRVGGQRRRGLPRDQGHAGHVGHPRLGPRRPDHSRGRSGERQAAGRADEPSARVGRGEADHSSLSAIDVRWACTTSRSGRAASRSRSSSEHWPPKVR